ncbi:MAG: glutamine-hydrolyzing carbamoyl-phosphate synthase small subunit [Thaumarchaeota archaeon]|nr:glutamine-hydrolyzing carbamoyl-phosphate synthase small subunit [Nitrososphaerota archaeon]
MEKTEGSNPAVLLLEDGSLFLGKGFGAETTTVAEVVFTTGMVGYPESMTDPSYAGQVLTFTYPLIGNYGVPSMQDLDLMGLPRQFESESIKVSGIIVQENCERPNHWDSKRTISEWMRGEGIPGISDIDTRALVTKLRETGVMMGVLANGVELSSRRDLMRLLRQSTKYGSIDFVRKVSPTKAQTYGESDRRVVLLDCGTKLSIIRNLLTRGYSVVRAPFDYSYADIMKHDPVGVVISNGPGDPQLCGDTVATTARLIQSEMPTLGICLGEQLVAISQGAVTYKLKYGHRGQNKPVVDLVSGRGYVTSENHGYSVDGQSLSKTELRPWFVNADDRSIEGLIHTNKPCISVQFHPEASPGPYDAGFVFDRFASLAEGQKTEGERVRTMRM